MKHIQHYEANKAVFDAWIDCNSNLQVSADILQPLIEPFKKEFPSVNLVGCPECIIDMLRWVKSEWKKTQEVKPKGKK